MQAHFTLSSLSSVGLMPPVKFGSSNKESTTGSLHLVTHASSNEKREKPHLDQHHGFRCVRMP